MGNQKMKKWSVFILLITVLFSLTACLERSHTATQDGDGTNYNSYTDTQSIENADDIDSEVQSTVVFDTENVKRITLYSYYGCGIGSDVPAEHLQEIITWLDSFEIDFERKADDLLPPGTNTVHVEIEYLDGTVIKQGIDTITVEGARYYLSRSDFPGCYQNILSRTSLS